MRITKRSAAVATAGLLTVAVTGGVAYAYWTSGGIGTGTASTRTGTAAAFTVAGNAATQMYPGDSAQTVTATVTNVGEENYTLQKVVAWVTTDKTGCTGADYLLNGSAAPVDQASATDLGFTVVDLTPAGTATKDYSLQFNNLSDKNQDACKSAAVTVHYLAS